MSVDHPVEERYRDTDFALVIPSRLELTTRLASDGPWGFAFAGFSTNWKNPIALEVTGSGGYEPHDAFSLAGLSLDFGTAGGFTERSIFGLGLIQTARSAHPPGWGVGTSGKIVCRANLLNATPTPQKVTIDPSKFAPPNWDGRLWIGLMLHNVGPGKWLKARILNATPLINTSIKTSYDPVFIDRSTAAEPTDAQQWKLLAQHQKEFLQYAAAKLGQAPGTQPSIDKIVAPMRPYAKNARPDDVTGVRTPIDNALAAYDKSPAGAAGFLRLAESFFHFQHTRTDGNHLTAALNQSYAHWQASGSFGIDIGCIIRRATNMEKIGLADVESGKILAAGEEVCISAARNEYEGFQIVLTPIAPQNLHSRAAEARGSTDKPRVAGNPTTTTNHEPAASTNESSASQFRGLPPLGYEQSANSAPQDRNVTVAASDFTGPGSTIPSSQITVNPVGYVRIFRDSPRERIVPDPLLIGPVPPLVVGENQPIWISVHVPMDAAPGFYDGAVTITSGSAAVVVPVKLTVRSFAIPKKISLRSSFWMFRDQINRFYHLDEVSFDDYMKWIDIAVQHRVNPIDVYEGHCTPLVDISLPRQKWDKNNTIYIGRPNPHPDFTQWDRYIDRMIRDGANTIPLGISHHFGSFFCTTHDDAGKPDQVERVKEAVRIMVDHAKSRGTYPLGYFQLRDETSEPSSLNVYRGVHQAFPDLKLLLTVPSQAARPFVTIPCPQTPGFDAGWRDAMHRENNEYWWYVCLSPDDPYANLFIFQTTAQHRALFWQTWTHHVDGLLYWGMNFWSWYDSTWPAGVTAQTTRIARKDWPDVASIPDHPGDGFSIYPGPTPGEPMSSIRLEAIRDGEEDYEYFILLQSLLNKATAAGRSDAATTEAQSALNAAKKLVASMTGYEKTGQPYLDVRDRVAKAIEKLMQ